MELRILYVGSLFISYEIYWHSVYICHSAIVLSFPPIEWIHMVAELGSRSLEDLRDRKGGKSEILKSEEFWKWLDKFFGEDLPCLMEMFITIVKVNGY